MNTIVSRVKYTVYIVTSGQFFAITPLIKTMHIYINLHFVVIAGFIIMFL